MNLPFPARLLGRPGIPSPLRPPGGRSPASTEGPESGDRYQSSGRAASLALVGAVLTMITNFGIAKLLADTGAATAGVFFAVTALATILGNSAALGTMTGLVYFLPAELDRPDPAPGTVVRMAMIPVVVAGLLAAGGLVVAAGPVAAVIAGDRASDAAAMLRVLAIAVPAWALTNALLGATRAMGSMTPTVAIHQVFKPVAQLAAIAAVVIPAGRDPDPVAMAAAWTVPIVVSAAAAAVVVAAQGGFSSTGTTTVTTKQFWAYTRPRAAATAFQIALERVDVILVSALAGQSAAGVYGVLTRYITAGNFLVFSIAQSTVPRLRRAVARQKLHQAQALLQRVTGWMVLLAWPYFLVVATRAESLIALLDPSMVEGSTALVVLALALLVHAATGPIDLTLLMLGRSKTSLAAAAAALVTDVALAWILIPSYGLVGAALAWGLAVAVQNGVASIVAHRAAGLRAPGRGSVVAAGGALVAVLPAAAVAPAGFAGTVATALVAGLVLVAWSIRFASALDLPIPALGPQR